MSSTDSKKKHLIIKIIKIVVAIIIVFLIVYNVIWFYCYSIYKPFMDVVGRDEYGNRACMDEDRVVYSVFPPDYFFDFTGNLAICDYRKSDLKPGDILVDMIIWPSIKGTYKVGFALSVAEETEKKGDSYSITTKGAAFELDENMNFLKEYSDEDKKLFEEHRDTIERYYQKAYDMWGILGKP